jgi:radical SAM superfamily enzyme
MLCEDFKIPTGVHLIMGIPNESIASIMETINFVNNQKNIRDVKIHNLVVYKNSKLADIYQDFNFLTYSEYLLLLAKAIGHLSPEKSVSRLFTSNLRRDSVAISAFPGFKQIWLKELWLLLKKRSIFQGSYLT